MRRKIVLLVILALQTVILCAQQTANEKQARRIFNQAYNQVFGEQGATLHYDVNIIGIYKTSGTIWYKGKKQKFVDERVNTWNDGKTAYMAFRKKKEVHIHDAKSDKKDKYSGKFKFDLDDFDYSITEDEGMFLITLKQKTLRSRSGTGLRKNSSSRVLSESASTKYLQNSEVIIKNRMPQLYFPTPTGRIRSGLFRYRIFYSSANTQPKDYPRSMLRP